MEYPGHQGSANGLRSAAGRLAHGPQEQGDAQYQPRREQHHRPQWPQSGMCEHPRFPSLQCSAGAAGYDWQRAQAASL